MARDHGNQETNLVSTSTILILSGFLIGLSVGKVVSEDLSPYVMACGLSGFLAFIALDQAKIRRQKTQALEDRLQMEKRLDKHVNSLSSISFVLPPPEESFSEEAEESEFDIPVEVAVAT